MAIPPCSESMLSMVSEAQERPCVGVFDRVFIIYCRCAEFRCVESLSRSTMSASSSIESFSWSTPLCTPTAERIPQERIFGSVRNKESEKPLLPCDRLCYLFIDANRWEMAQSSGSFSRCFDEKEPGYMAAMMEAFRYSQQEMKAITADTIEMLHDKAVEGVLDSKTGRPLDKGYRTQTNSTGFVLKRDENYSQAGFEELMKKHKCPVYECQTTPEEGETQNLFKMLLSNPNQTSKGRNPEIRTRPNNSEAVRAGVNRLIQIYRDTPKRNDEEKLIASILLVQNLDQIHPFFDGNIRTFGILLFNKLLMDDGFYPCCFWDPNVLDCLSIGELIVKVREGQRRFLRLCEAETLEELVKTDPEHRPAS